VGVVGPSRILSVDSLPTPVMYFPHGQFPWPAMWMTIRAAGTIDPALLGAAVRRELKALDPNLPFAQVQPLTQLVTLATAGPRLTMLVFAIFGVAALVLVAAGLYGVVSYTVSQRTREIGVRLALGAEPWRVVRAVVRQGLWLAAMGVAVGSVAAFGLVRMLRTILYETQPTDAPTFVAVGLLLLALGALASAAPARRAARLDPVRALRAE
jgi:putative ABC transport system permease protein